METSTRQRMIENIMLLWTLNEVPELPMENALDCKTDETRQLTSERELQLASDFAFISASTDDMLRVMAVCVEEDADQQGMTIRLASNTGALMRTVESFKDIAGTLERAALRVDSRNFLRLELFRQILVLDELRILSRLRSKHALRTRKTAGKPVLTDLLSRSINDPSIRIGKTAKASLEKVKLQSNSFSETFAKFEARREHDAGPEKSMDILADLLRQALEFDTTYLRTALHTSSVIDPNLKDFLPEAIRKIGRYCSVANDLVDAARSSRYMIFRRISVKGLEEPATIPASVTKNLLGFEAVLERNFGLQYRHSDWRRHSYSLEAARTRYESRKNCTTPWKVHAEMQLLFFYEQNHGVPHPRIICSSKSACFLCNLFIGIHGRFHTPRSHGRLYDKWIFPEWVSENPSANQRVSSAIDRLNTTLQDMIMQYLNHRQRAHPHPNESSVQLREPWTSTSTLSQARIRQPDTDPPEIVLDATSRGLNVSQSSVLVSMTSQSLVEVTLQSMEVGNQTENVLQDAHLPRVDEITRANSSFPAVQSLSRGESVCYELNSTANMLIICTEVLNLHVSWEFSTISSGDTKSARWIQVKWLASEIRGAESYIDADVIDIDTITDEKDTVVDGRPDSSARPLAIRNGEQIVILRWLYEP